MKIKTINDIRELIPCYDPATGLSLDGDKINDGYLSEDWKGTILDILRLQKCPIRDRIWVVSQEEWIEDAVLQKWGRWCALQVAPLWDMPAIVGGFLETGNEKLRDVARDAARAAAWDAARAAAWDAGSAAAWDAGSAVWAAEWNAARSAVWAAAWSIVRDAVKDAAGDAVRAVGDAAGEKFIDKLIEMLEANDQATPASR